MVGQVIHDIANHDALQANVDAWKFVRLYFRPKTNFHLRTEGIKLLTDGYRLPFHMSIPVLFIFNLEKILTKPGVCFSNRKMAHAGMTPGEDWRYFQGIDFAKVYHEGPLARSEMAEVQDIRMAEVLVPGGRNYPCALGFSDAG